MRRITFLFADTGWTRSRTRQSPFGGASADQDLILHSGWQFGDFGPPTPIYLEKRRLGTRTVHRMAARVCPLSARWIGRRLWLRSTSLPMRPATSFQALLWGKPLLHLGHGDHGRLRGRDGTSRPSQGVGDPGPIPPVGVPPPRPRVREPGPARLLLQARYRPLTSPLLGHGQRGSATNNRSRMLTITSRPRKAMAGQCQRFEPKGGAPRSRSSRTG